MNQDDVEHRIDGMLRNFDSAVERRLREARAWLRGHDPRGHELVFDNDTALVFGISPPGRTRDAFIRMLSRSRRRCSRREHSVRISLAAPIALLVGIAQATGSNDAGPTVRVDAPSTAHRSPAKKPGPAVAVRPAPSDVPPLDLSEPVIRQAIADSRDPIEDGLDRVASPRAAFGAGGPASQQAIDQGFKRAEIPTCMTPEAYTFDPPQVGPVGLGGFLALPFLVHAIATGKCRH